MKKALIILFTTIILGMLILTSLVVIIDPFFHYHKVIKNHYPRFYNEIYQDPGMALNFDYDSVIIGSSMTENFHVSSLHEYGVNPVKLSYSGGSTKDISTLLNLAFSSGNDIQYVYIDLNDYQLCADKDYVFTDIPSYLYDKNVLTDVQYIFNKDVIHECLMELRDDLSYTFFKKDLESSVEEIIDRAFTWEDEDLFGIEKVLEDLDSTHIDQAWIADNSIASIEALNNVPLNMENIISIVRKHPDTRFFIYYPPYSAAYWYDIHRQGVIDAKIDMLRISMESLLDLDNVDIYMFMDDYEDIVMLDSYRDICHFNPYMNEYMLKCMQTGDFKIDKDNYIHRLSELKKFANEYKIEQ